MSTEDTTPPANHPTWAPAGEAGHYCISERWCPCGHMNRSRNYPTRNLSGKKGQPTIDAIEDNDDGSR